LLKNVLPFSIEAFDAEPRGDAFTTRIVLLGFLRKVTFPLRECWKASDELVRRWFGWLAMYDAELLLEWCSSREPRLAPL
jgi:hypothetical protein